MKESVIVIGGGASGAVFSNQYKKMMKDSADVILLEKSPYVGWSGCPMPYFIGEELSDKAVVGPGSDYFINKLGVGALVGMEVISIDAQAKKVEVRSVETGEMDTLDYTKLVLAMGARPRSFTAKGLENLKSGYFHLVHPNDAMEITSYLESNKPKKAVLMGTGAIGLEMAEAFIERGLEVEMFTNTETLFQGFYDRELLDPLYARLEAKGIKIHYEAMLDSIQTTEQGGFKSLTLADGTVLAGDIMLTAIGVEPNLSLAEKAGIVIENNRIAVNEFMQTSDESIFALGDLVGTKNVITGTMIYSPLGDVADKQAIVLASHLAGKNRRPFKGVVATSTTSFYDIKLARTGLTEDLARKAGYEPVMAEARAVTKISDFPDSKVSGGTMRLIYDKETRKILGASMVGYNAVAQFIDQVAIAINFGASLDDMFDVDYAYSPTNASVWNPFLIAYRKTLK